MRLGPPFVVIRCHVGGVTKARRVEPCCLLPVYKGKKRRETRLTRLEPCCCCWAVSPMRKRM